MRTTEGSAEQLRWCRRGELISQTLNLLAFYRSRLNANGGAAEDVNDGLIGMFGRDRSVQSIRRPGHRPRDRRMRREGDWIG